MKKLQKGYILLLSTLMLAATGLALALAGLLSGSLNLKAILILQSNGHAKALANACAEKALLNLRQNPNYTGNETLTLTEGTCEILTVVKSGNSYTVKTKGNSDQSVRKVQITASLSVNQNGTTTSVSLWREVADF